MTQLLCPETPDECGRKGSQGMWSHLHHKHGWDKEEAKQWVRRQKAGNSDDDEPDSGASEAPSDDPEDSSDQVPEEDEGAIVVNEEGSEKLSPEGFDSRNRPEMDPPEGADLPDDVTPDDFESTEGDECVSSPSESVSSEESTSQNPGPEPDDDGEEDSGGVLSKLRDRGGDDEDENPEQSPQEIVEEADDPEEQERRQRVLDALNEGANDEDGNRDERPERQPNQADASPSGHTESDPSPKPAQMQNGMVVDEKLLETLFGLPFDQAANVTGWEGWRLSPEEKEANARLLRAYADEQDIDLGPGVMLAMSLGSTVGGRVVGYTRHRKQQTSDQTTPDTDTEPREETHQRQQARDSRESQPNSGNRPDRGRDTTGQQTGEFNFDKPGFGQNSPQNTPQGA